MTVYLLMFKTTQLSNTSEFLVYLTTEVLRASEQALSKGPAKLTKRMCTEPWVSDCPVMSGHVR